MGDWDPRAYGHVNNLQQEVARRALSDLMVSGDERVLDVGCGDGKVTALIMERLTTGSLLGVDPSLPMVEAARRRLSTASHAQFAVGTAATLPYDAEFDLATSFNALHWEIRWETALQRIRAALRPTGRAFLVFVCDGERPSIEDVTAETARSARWASWFEEFDAPYVHVDPDVYAAAARSAGFAVERVVVDDLDWNFGTPTRFVEWSTAGLVAWTSRLPPEDQPPFVLDVVSAYAKIIGSPSVFRFLQCRVALTASDQETGSAASG
ncbi:MAG TPA: class I SAM-dependent methyltransferase [Microlunatus sp.]